MAEFGLKRLNQALDTLGRVLDDRSLQYEVVIVGGAALTLNLATVRPTQDVDAIAVSEGWSDEPRRVHQLPAPLAEAVVDVASGLGLEADWLNVAVGAFVPPLRVDEVTDDAASRVYGGLRVTIANRLTLAKLKLYAAVDEGPGSVHEMDLRQLELDADHVRVVTDWYRERFEGREDPGFREMVHRVWGLQ